ncbi:MAG TPA: DUF4388 domain-containing protein [Ktedonobacteraceae bacterium]|jgi:hypothetical protein
MAQQREATTDRLVGIITQIKMERKSGQLRVKRGEGMTQEEGLLTFAQGQVTQASIGRRSGAEAVNWLSTWGHARYLFLSANGDMQAPLAPISLAYAPGGPFTNPALLTARVNTDRLDTESLKLTPPPLLTEEIPHLRIQLSEVSGQIERAGLSRAHRRLSLLIDGHRSVHELAPLIGRGADEVRSMLHDLEWLGILQITVSSGPW